MNEEPIYLQQYEIDNILKSLRHEIQKEQRENCKWEFQNLSGMFYYTPNKKVKQLEFTIRSILRQTGKNE